MSELHKKLSCVPVSFFKDIISGNMSFYELALFCKKQGLSAVDLGVTLLGDRKETSLIDIRNQVEEAGVTIAGIMAYPDFTNPEEKKRINEIDNLERDLEAASTLGAKFVRITAGQSHKGLRRERGISLAVNGILEAISLSKLGVFAKATALPGPGGAIPHPSRISRVTNFCC